MPPNVPILTRSRGAVSFTAKMAINFDGCPRAYAPRARTDLHPLDDLDNAGHPDRWVDDGGEPVTEPELLASLSGHESDPPPGYRWQRRAWWGIACDGNDQPYIQGPTDPAPGFYVSTTALVDRTKLTRDPRRYVDASVVPFIVIPPELKQMGFKLGDLAMVSCGSRQASAIVADIGPSKHYGEGSPALAELLAVPSGRKGGVDAGVRYVIFADSAAIPRWPRPPLEFQAAAARLHAEWLQPR